RDDAAVEAGVEAAVDTDLDAAAVRIGAGRTIAAARAAARPVARAAVAAFVDVRALRIVTARVEAARAVQRVASRRERDERAGRSDDHRTRRQWAETDAHQTTYSAIPGDASTRPRKRTRRIPRARGAPVRRSVRAQPALSLLR